MSNMSKIDWERWNTVSSWLRKNGILGCESSFTEEEVQHFNETLATMEKSILGLEDLIVIAKARGKSSGS